MVKIKYARPKIFASRLVGSRGPKMAHGPLFGNHWCTDKHEVQWNRHSSFSNIKLFWIFCTFGLKMPVYAPRLGFLAISPPTWGAVSTKPPKGTSLPYLSARRLSHQVRKSVDRSDRKTHTRTHPFNGPFSGTTRVSRYQKGKTNLDFTVARDSVWQWHHLGHMQVCTLAPDR